MLPNSKLLEVHWISSSLGRSTRDLGYESGPFNNEVHSSSFTPLNTFSPRAIRLRFGQSILHSQRTRLLSITL